MNNQISNEARENITGVVDRTFKAAAAGEDPTEVLAKEATEANLTVEQTKRAAEATNVSITLAYNKQASAEDRAKSDFEIVCPDEVIAKMFPKEAKKKCKKKMKKEAPDAYDLSPTKEASMNLLDVEVEPIRLTKEQLYKMASDHIRLGEALLDETMTEQTAVMFKADAGLQKIAGMVEGLYGDSSASIEDEDIREYVDGMINKSASEKPARDPSSMLVEAVEEVKGLLKQAAELSERVSEAEEELSTLKKFAAGETYNPLSGDPADGPIATPKIGPLDVGRMINPAIGTFLKATTQSPGAKKQIHENFKYNPTSDEKFLNIVDTRQTLKNAVMLSNLMQTDEVLSKAEPDRVINAYNDIFAGMPQLTNSPELTRSALRYAVEYGGMDFPTMMGMVKDVSKMQGPMQSQQQKLEVLGDKISEKGRAQKETYTQSLRDIDEQKQKARKEIEDNKQRLKEKRKDLKRDDKLRGKQRELQVEDRDEARTYSEQQADKAREQQLEDRDEARTYSETDRAKEVSRLKKDKQKDISRQSRKENFEYNRSKADKTTERDEKRKFEAKQKQEAEDKESKRIDDAIDQSKGDWEAAIVDRAIADVLKNDPNADQGTIANAADNAVEIAKRNIRAKVYEGLEKERITGKRGK